MCKIITKNKYPEIFEWLDNNVLCYHNNEKYQKKFIFFDNKIHVNDYLYFSKHTENIKYPFGNVYGCFECRNNHHLTSFNNMPKYVDGYFDVRGCVNLKSLKNTPIIAKNLFYNFDGCKSLKSLEGCPDGHNNFTFTDMPSLTSLKGLPKKATYIIFNNLNIFSINPNDTQKYNKYIDMWFELFESVCDDEKNEYINNYKDKISSHFNFPIIPKEVMNKYKIDFLLKDK